MSNAPARVTVIYRVQVTKTSYGYTKPATKTSLIKHKYKSKTYAEQIAKNLTYKLHDASGKLLFECTGIVISHTASTPLH